MMRKIFAGVIVLLFTSISVFAELPDYMSSDPEVLKQIDVDSMDPDELREAYKHLRSAYETIYDLYIEKALEAEGATHTTDSTELSSNDQDDKSLWQQKFYVDEFDEVTDESYLTCIDKLTGTFSNSAATDRDGLNVHMIVDREYVAFDIYTYNDSLVTNLYDQDKEYGIIMQDGAGSKYEFNGAMLSGGSRVYIYFEQYDNIIDMLKGNDGVGQIKIIITCTDRPLEKYKFTIPEYNNFTKEYENAFS